MRGIVGFFMLLPLLIVFALATGLALSILYFAFLGVAGCGGFCIKKGGLWRLLGVLASFVIGGICIRLGYWVAYEVSIEPMLSFLYSEVKFPFIDWIFPFVFPILGWIDMVGGGLIATLGTWFALFGKKEQ